MNLGKKFAAALLPAALCSRPLPLGAMAHTVVIDADPGDIDIYPYDDNDDDDAPDAIVEPDEEDAVIIERNEVRAPGTAVYGWSERNGCGTYYFWDGEACIDARLK